MKNWVGFTWTITGKFSQVRAKVIGQDGFSERWLIRYEPVVPRMDAHYGTMATEELETRNAC